MKKMVSYPVIAVVFAVVLLWNQTVFSQGGKSVAAPRTCVDYQSDKCYGGKNVKCSSCSCNPCTADGKCSCLVTVRENSGSIKGNINIVKTRVKTEGPKSQKEVIVYLEPIAQEGVKAKVYPVPCKNPIMNQKGLVFIPHVMAVQKGSTVDYLNSDEVLHNIFCMDNCCKILEEQPKGKGKFMDLGNWGKGEMKSYMFNVTGEAVLLCRLHPEMAAYTLVVETPFFTVSQIEKESQASEYVIKNVPPGKYHLKTWNKRCVSEVTEVTIEKGKATQADVKLTRKKRKRRR